MVKGFWKKAEQERYRFARMQYGHDWAKISKHVKTRNANQCRSHGQKFDVKLFQKEATKMAQTDFEDPRIYKDVIIEETDFDDVDKYFYFADITCF